jgi:hypothetical protein
MPRDPFRWEAPFAWRRELQPALVRRRSISDDFLIGAVCVLVLIGVVSWVAGPGAGPPVPILTKPATHITLGSTKADVERIQGRPTLRAESTWQYGNSLVFFREGRVTGWHVAKGSALKVRLAPSTKVRAERIQIGSTKDEVAAVHGTPGALRDDVWHYGASKVHFRDGKVVAWSNPTAYPLKVQGSSGPAPRP